MFCWNTNRNLNNLSKPLVSMAGCAIWFNLNGTMYEKLRECQKAEDKLNISADLFAKSIVLRYLNVDEGKTTTETSQEH